MHFYASSRQKGCNDMSLSQMKHEAKYRIFIPRIWCFWHLRSSSGRMHWKSMGCKLSNFFSINNFRGVRIMLAQRQRAKQQFYKNSNSNTQAEIENRLFPICLIQREIIWDREKFKLNLKQFGGVLSLNNDVGLLTDIRTRLWCSAEGLCQVQSECWWKKLIFN